MLLEAVSAVWMSSRRGVSTAPKLSGLQARTTTWFTAMKRCVAVMSGLQMMQMQQLQQMTVRDAGSIVVAAAARADGTTEADHIVTMIGEMGVMTGVDVTIDGMEDMNEETIEEVEDMVTQETTEEIEITTDPETQIETAIDTIDIDDRPNIKASKTIQNTLLIAIRTNPCLIIS